MNDPAKAAYVKAVLTRAIDFGEQIKAIESERDKSQYMFSLLLFKITEHLNKLETEQVWREVTKIIKDFEERYDELYTRF